MKRKPQPSSHLSEAQLKRLASLSYVKGAIIFCGCAVCRAKIAAIKPYT
jgi:hypothetical protein